MLKPDIFIDGKVISKSDNIEVSVNEKALEMCRLRYIDVFYEAYHLVHESYAAALDKRVLAWTSNHEHAVFQLDDEVHASVVCVWFQFQRGGVDTIHKMHRKANTWELAENSSVGRIPFVNNNPFDPRKQNAASNTAESVFPQNKGY